MKLYSFVQFLIVLNSWNWVKCYNSKEKHWVNIIFILKTNIYKYLIYNYLIERKVNYKKKLLN